MTPTLSDFLLRMVRSIFTAALCFLLAPSLSASPQEAANGNRPNGTLRSTSSVVNLYAVVEGRHGQLIRDLNKDDFQVADNGIPQNIQYFSQDTNIPLSLGIALDTSNSQAHLLKTEQDAAKEFLRVVLAKGDQACVMTFDTDVRLVQDFTDTSTVLAKAIDAAQINETGKSILRMNSTNAPILAGGTHLYDAIYLASDELMKSRHGREVLVLVTDGEDQGSRIDLRNAIEAAEKVNLIVYSIVVSDPEFYTMMDATYRGDAHVRELTSTTGGRTIRVRSPKQIAQAFEQIERELHSQYRLGYLPPNLRNDGSFRKIVVKIRGRSYTVRTRSGYYDLRAESRPN